MEGEVEDYKFLVISYMESANSYHTKYSSNDGRSSKFDTIRAYDKDEVINHIFGLELGEALNNNYVSIKYLFFDHYIYTPENTFGPTCDEYGDYIYYDGPELPQEWRKEIVERVNTDLKRRQAEKEAARLEKERQAVIMKEQQEEREYKRLSKKYGVLSEVGVSFTKFSQ